MGKQPRKRNSAAEKDAQMNRAMKLFLAGCAGEFYLLILRRFYINAGAALQIEWYDRYLWILMGAGAAALAAGLLGLLRRGDHPLWRQGMGILAGAGAFVAAVSGIVRWNMDTVSVLVVVTPAVMLMGLLWSLYDRECALALTVLGVTLLALVGLRRYGASLRYGLALRLVLWLYVLALAALAAALRGGRLARPVGRFGPLLPAKADPAPVYLSCGISCVCLAAALLLGALSYYILWALAAVVFALGVYYTVRQL